MHTVYQCRFTAIDFESAGAVRGKTDTPVQVGLASWSPESGHSHAFVSYLRTDQPIHWAAQKVHGITAGDLKNAPSLLTLWPELKSVSAEPLSWLMEKGRKSGFCVHFPVMDLDHGWTLYC